MIINKKKIGPDFFLLSTKKHFTTYLSKQSLAAAARRCRIVNVNIMIFGRNRFLDERLIEYDPIHFNMILRLDQLMLCNNTFI